MAVIPEGLVSLGPQDYGEYLAHQAHKIEIDAKAQTYYEPQYRATLRERLRALELVQPGASVLCLGARWGAEVQAFIDLEAFAVGLDLNPSEGNKYVVCGDFHKIQYANHSIAIVFTNAVDHVFNLGIFISEICRVLKPGGLLIMDLIKGTGEGGEPGDYESLFWERIDDILAPFLAGPFELVHRHDFDRPWPGEHIVLARRSGLSEKKLVGNIIVEAMMIPGRCVAPELIFLNQMARVAPWGKPIVELGTFQGRTAAPLCAGAKEIEAEVITIDNYAHDPAFVAWPKGYENDPECGKTPEEYAELTRANLAGLGFHPRVIAGDSAIVPEGIEEVGMLFIDSAHNAERFTVECDAWLPLMEMGSILACHDYGQPAWPEMTPAIDDRITPDEWEELGRVVWLKGFRKK